MFTECKVGDVIEMMGKEWRIEDVIGEFVSTYPHKNIFASKYNLADTQSVSGSHRQQNNEYFDKAFNLKSWVLLFL